MNSVFELGGELLRADIAHNLMRLIAEGSGEHEDVDVELRRYAATHGTWRPGARWRALRRHGAPLTHVR